MTPSGLPHSEIPESKCAYHSSRLFAVSHVLLRLHMPRHPPYAVTCLTLITLQTDLMSHHVIVKEHRNRTRFASESKTNFQPSLSACTGKLRLLRKEVIQPQVPLRLPCYDFTPVADLTVVGCLLAVSTPASGKANSHGVTGGVYKARERIHRGMLIRDY